MAPFKEFGVALVTLFDDDGGVEEVRAFTDTRWGLVPEPCRPGPPPGMGPAGS